MRQEKTSDKILNVLYEHPGEEFTVRAISKLAKLPRATVQVYLKEFRKEGLIDDLNQPKHALLFKTKKMNYYMEKIISSGLLDELIIQLNPSCIILFGSIRKGESDNSSDIDLFIETPMKKDVDLKIYEKKLGHTIQLFTESDINALPKHLLNNVINGVKLYGVFALK